MSAPVDLQKRFAAPISGATCTYVDAAAPSVVVTPPRATTEEGSQPYELTLLDELREEFARLAIVAEYRQRGELVPDYGQDRRQAQWALETLEAYVRMADETLATERRRADAAETAARLNAETAATQRAEMRRLEGVIARLQGELKGVRVVA